MSRFVYLDPKRHLINSARAGAVRCVVVSDSRKTETPNLTEDVALGGFAALRRKLERDNPDVPVGVKTLGIGGSRGSNLSTTRFATVQAILDAGLSEPDWLAAEELAQSKDRTTHSWLDFIKGAYGANAPTLIYLAFGENSRAAWDSAAWIEFLKVFRTDAVLQNCDIILETNAVSNPFAASLALTTDAERAARIEDCNYAGQAIRSVARYYDYGLIDCNAWSNCALWGKDVLKTKWFDAETAESVTLPHTAAADTEMEHGVSVALAMTGVNIEDLNPGTGDEAGLYISLGEEGSLAESFAKFTSDGDGKIELTLCLTPAFIGADGRYHTVTSVVDVATSGTQTFSLFIRDLTVNAKVGDVTIYRGPAIMTGGKFKPVVKMLDGSTPSATITAWRCEHPDVKTTAKFADVYGSDEVDDDGNEVNHFTPYGVQLIEDELLREVSLTLPQASFPIPALANGDSYDITPAQASGWLFLNSANPNIHAFFRFNLASEVAEEVKPSGASVTVNTAADFSSLPTLVSGDLNVTVTPDGIRLRSDLAASLGTGWFQIIGR